MKNAIGSMRTWFLLAGILLFGAVLPAAAADERYVRLFNEIGNTIESNFYDRSVIGEKFAAVRQRYARKAAAVRTQEQFAGLVNAMLAELKSSHTHYYTPEEPAYYQLLSIFKAHPNVRGLVKDGSLLYPSVGIETERRKGRIFVVSVYEGGPAEKAGLLKGDEILSADGNPFAPVASLRERAGQPVRFSVRRRAGKAPLAIDIVPALVDPKEEFLASERASVRLLDAGQKMIGYIHILSYAGEEFNGAFLEALAGPLKDADALVWDLRDGWGGADPGYLNVFNDKVPVLSFAVRDGGTHTYDPQWRKPVLMLVNGRVRSGKEILAYAFRKYGTGKVVGEKTAGAVLGGTPFAFSDGSLLYLAVQDVRVDGEILEGKGVAPDIAVPMPIEYLGGRDVQLEKAVEYLGKTLE